MKQIKAYWKLIIPLILTAAVIIGYPLSGKNKVRRYEAESSTNLMQNQEQIFLEFYIWSDEESYIAPVVEAYNALQTTAHVNIHVIENDIYDDEIKKLISEPDRVVVDLLGVRGISKVIQFQEKGKLLDLTDYLENSDIDVTAYGSMFNDITLNGRYFGMPARSTCWALFYNKDIFDAAGIPYPRQMTWQEYGNLAKRLTSGEGDNKIWGGYWVTWCYNFGALQRNSSLIDDDTSHIRETLLLLNQFYHVDRSHMPYKEMKDMEADGSGMTYRKLFSSGKIAMIPQGEWLVNMLMEDEKNNLTDINWDIAPMPVFEGVESGTTWGQYQFVAISSNTKWPDEAFSFLKFICGEDGARIYARNGIIHAYSDDEIKSIYMNTVKKESASVFFEAKRVQEQLAVSGYQETLELLEECANSYFEGKKTIDETMKDFNEGREIILSR